jgi:hypothetical protein
MPDLAVPRGYDAYGHPNDWTTQNVAGFKATSGGTAAGTIVKGAALGTITLAPPYCVSDAYGQFTITPTTLKTAALLFTVYFQNPYPFVRPVLATITGSAGLTSKGGTLTIAMTPTSLAITNATALVTSGAVYNVSYVIL